MLWVPLVSESGLEELEKFHPSFLHRLLDVPRMTTAEHMYAETGRPQQSIKCKHPLSSLVQTHVAHKCLNE